MTSLVVQRVESTEALMALEPEWTALEQASANTLPFRTFAWTSSWWKHMHEERFAVRDSLAIRIARTDDGRLVGVAPFMLTERPSRGPIRARCLHFIGADPNVTEMRAALFLPELEAACYAAIYADLTQTARSVDWVRWTGIDTNRRGREALDDPRIRWGEGVLFCIVPLPGSFEELRARCSRNLREALRRCYKSLARDGLAPSFEVVTSPEATPPALEDFFRLHEARARMPGTLDHNDVFAHPACRGFLLDVCRSFATDNRLRVFRLSVNGQLAATRIGLVLGDCLYLYYSGFDPAFAQYGVMTTAVAEAMKYAIGAGLRTVNLSTGRDAWKQRWRPEEHVYAEALVVPRTLGRAKLEALEAAQRAVHQPGLQRYAERLLTRRAPAN